MEQEEAPESPASRQAVHRNQRDLDARKTAVEAEIAATQRRIAAAAVAERSALQAKAAELQSELDLVNARRNLLNNMAEFAHETDANGSGVSALREHINAIAASIPAAESAAVVPDGSAEPQANAAGGIGSAAPLTTGEQVSAISFTPRKRPRAQPVTGSIMTSTRVSLPPGGLGALATRLRRAISRPCYQNASGAHSPVSVPTSR